MMKFEDATGVPLWLDPRRVLMVRPVFPKLQEGQDPAERQPVDDHAQLIIEGMGEAPIVKGAPGATAELIMKKAFQAQVVTLRDGLAPALKQHVAELQKA